MLQEAKARRLLLITPLVALARQQERRLAGILGEALVRAGGARPPEGRAGAWILSPEALLSGASLARIAAWQPDFLVVDECHCVWEWGEEFRPAFRRIPELLNQRSITRSLWLTATLPPQARQELLRGIARPVHQIGNFELPAGLELRAHLSPWVSRADALLGWSALQFEPGIIFAPTRETSERLARLIRSTGRSAVFYHAGLSSEERRELECRIAAEASLPGRGCVIVATSAFGMGMDQRHLRWVALWQAPHSLLTLAQALGRVTRSPNARARALLLWHEDDFRLLEWSVGESARRKAELLAVQRFFSSQGCRRAALSRYFHPAFPAAVGTLPLSCGSRCDRCA